MKKYLCFLILTALVFSSVSCAGANSQQYISIENYDIKAATNIVDTYMKFLMRDDTENAKKLLSSKLSKDAKANFTNEEKIVGYTITETEEAGKNANIKVRVARSANMQPTASLDEYTIKVTKEGSDYKIDDIKNDIQKEVFADVSGIRLRTKDSADTNLLINAEGIPDYAFSKDDKPNLYKLQVPKKSFGVASFSYNGDKLAFTTHNRDYFIGIVSIEETLATQAGGGGGGQGGGGGGAGGGGGGPKAGGQQGGQQPKPRETPIGKNPVTVDLLKGSTVQFLSFSRDGKYLLLQYDKPSQGRCIRLYKSDNGDIIPVKFEDKYPIGKVEILFSSFDDNVLNYEVTAKSNKASGLSGILGKWQMNLKDFSMKKI